ncbi:MAG: hypothetical protein HY898_19040 [Deltaproteobacteria bacterium]|nr:hypothetical protein [Deltaproteobacteria bacterium]
MALRVGWVIPCAVACVVAGATSCNAIFGIEDGEVAPAASTGGQAGSAGSTPDSSVGGSAGTGGASGASGQGGSSGSGNAAGAAGDAAAACEAGTCPAVWAKVFGDDPKDQSGNAVAVNAASDSILGGSFLGSIDFGGSNTVVDTKPGLTDSFVAKLDKNGSTIWAASYAGTLGSSANAVGVDSQGYIFASGTSGGNLVIAAPGGANPVYLESDSGQVWVRSWVAKLSPGGVPQWAQRLSSDYTDIRVASLAVDSAGAVIVAGKSDDGAPSVGNGANLFVQKFDDSGNLKWTIASGSTYDQSVAGVAVDSTDTVWLTGSYDDALACPPGCADVPNTGKLDGFVMRADPDTGNCKWVYGFGDAESQMGESVTIAPGDSVYVCGSFMGTMKTGSTQTPLSATVGKYSLFLAQYNTLGDAGWNRSFGTSSAPFGCRVTSDSDGNVVITGQYNGTVDFDGNPIDSLGARSVFFAKFDKNGMPLWSRMFGAADSTGEGQKGLGIATGPDKKIYLTGAGQGTFSFGSGTIKTSASSDIFLAVFEP